MKNIKYLLLLILPFIAMYSCSDDDASNPKFGDSELYIHGNWKENLAYGVGDVVSIEPTVSPSEDVTYKWTLDGEVISDKKALNYKIPGFLAGTLKFEVTRATGATTYREANIVVPQPFVPKTYTKKAIAFLTPEGKISDIDWNNVTHVIYSGAVVNSGGSIAVSSKVDIYTLVQFAHHFGVHITLEISGILTSYLNNVPVYGSYTFYDAAIADGTGLADKIVNTVKADKFDGVNILMDKSTSGSFEDLDKLKAFYENVGTKMKASQNSIDGKNYNYILSMSVWGGWTRGSLANCVNILTYDWINVLAFGATDLAPVPHSSQETAETETNTWLGWQGPIAPNRLVLAVPSFGIRYFGIPKDYTWGNLENYTQYMSYRSLCAKYPDAPSKNKIAVKDFTGDKNVEVDVTYYDGLADIAAKAEFVKSKNMAGMALWSIESDSKDPNQSLMKKINSSLGN